MADETIDVPVPLPPEPTTPDKTTGGAGEPNVAKTSGEVDATIDKVLDQAYAKAHENWLATMDYSNQGHQALNETGRWTFQAAASNQVQLAAGILAQRSAQAQPQSPGGAGLKGVPGQVGG